MTISPYSRMIELATKADEMFGTPSVDEIMQRIEARDASTGYLGFWDSRLVAEVKALQEELRRAKSV